MHAMLPCLPAVLESKPQQRPFPLDVMQSAVMAFRALRHRTVGALTGVSDDLLAQLLLALR